MELKPCPFCGGKPYIEDHHRAFINAQTTRVAYVRYRECEARTQRFSTELFGRSKAKEMAIEAWNRRTDDAEKES